MVKIFFVIHVSGSKTLYIWVDDKHLSSDFIFANFVFPVSFKEFITAIKELFSVEEIQICFPSGNKRAHLPLKECGEKELKKFGPGSFDRWPRALPVFPDMPWLKYGWQHYESLEDDLWPKIS
ncbi:MAG: hypothetical protein HY973_02100 [Candidatus Kerfeldbacteria bacterium]|nr:hypothetical protein [Candidatus Kerfeldbacteria bacterium]